ncbi:Uu.00g094490.m01.CDS01 [Anthostomella pinea]|uniref:carnosine N-methyltransferase n=1 Tax=Anthostomella pinea TaxID=933095 RepID=A0AAI8VNR3_9PEZI|nr:Uu.00g094490.m01.CDS01 [Anthostomella pinea]
MEQPELPPAEDNQWDGVEGTIEDPEEIRVIFCALDSFSQYAKTAHLNCTHLRRQAFYALPQAHWQMLAKPPFSYLDTLDRVDDAIEQNAELARIIVKFGLRSFGMVSGEEEPTMPEEWTGIAKYNDLDKARSTLRQFYRDWSAEGAVERDACYGPIYEALEAEKTRYPDRGPLKVLVPGAGLGRLVFDLCRKGYMSEGNEISYHQLLASSYILNSAERAGQHTIHPWIHSFSNHRSRENQSKGYAVPDIHPSTTLAATVGVGSMQMCAADFLCLYGDDAHRGAYDAVACVFFLDTAPNLVRYLDVIYRCLRPGGVLVNVGPLLWHWENHIAGHQHGYDGDDGDYDESNSLGIADPGSFELTDDEVMALVERMGFVVEVRQTGIHAPYVQDANSMLQTVYRASYWVARKPDDAAEVKTENGTKGEAEVKMDDTEVKADESKLQG